MTSTVHPPKPAVASRNRWLALTVLLAFMALLDTTIVNVAIPTMRTSIGASNATLSSSSSSSSRPDLSHS